MEVRALRNVDQTLTIISKDSDSMVALNSAQYGGGYPGPQCFKSITIQANGKTQVATIMDECPTCKSLQGIHPPITQN